VNLGRLVEKSEFDFLVKLTFFLVLFVSEKLSKNYEMCLTNTQVSVKNFDNLKKIEVAISHVRVYDARPVHNTLTGTKNDSL
jgi:hypothetical protein